MTAEKKSKTTKRYCAMPGFRFSGLPKFPFETDSEEVQGRIESSKAFKLAKRVWLDSRSKEEIGVINDSMKGVSKQTIIKLLESRGYRDLGRLSFADLAAIMEREGM
jgi:hypothetical protein